MTTTSKELIENLNWRYAAKRMNGKRVTDEKIERILEATRLAPSSMGLQPYTILVIDDPQLREQIRPVANGQPQIVEGSHVLVFAAWDKIDEKRAEEYVRSVAAVRKVQPEVLEAYKAKILRKAGGMTPEALFQWNARQLYIALGLAIAAAAAEQVDATPMEGFNPAALDELLGLREKGLRSVALLALGYRDSGRDALASARKVRRDPSKLFVPVP